MRSYFPALLPYSSFSVRLFFRHHLFQEGRPLRAANLFPRPEQLRQNDGDAGRNDITGALPVFAAQYRKSRTDDRRDDPAANVMRDIPEGAYASAFPTREPVCNGNKRGADAHALKRPLKTTRAANIQNALLNPSPTLTIAQSTRPHAMKTLGWLYPPDCSLRLY